MLNFVLSRQFNTKHTLISKSPYSSPLPRTSASFSCSSASESKDAHPDLGLDHDLEDGADDGEDVVNEDHHVPQVDELQLVVHVQLLAQLLPEELARLLEGKRRAVLASRPRCAHLHGSAVERSQETSCAATPPPTWTSVCTIY